MHSRLVLLRYIQNAVVEILNLANIIITILVKRNNTINLYLSDSIIRDSSIAAVPISVSCTESNGLRKNSSIRLTGVRVEHW